MIKKKYKQSQAAMEFLMVYGWALLVVLIVIAALVFFGVLNPDKYLSDKCDFGPYFECKAMQNSTHIILLVTNNYGKRIDNFNVSLYEETGLFTFTGAIVIGGYGGEPYGLGSDTTYTINPGETKKVTISIPPNEVKINSAKRGQKAKYRIKWTATVSIAGTALSKSGEGKLIVSIY